jgi:hypothetical protein
LDPYGKVGNPKAREIIQKIERNKKLSAVAERHLPHGNDSTGGSGEYGDYAPNQLES